MRLAYQDISAAQKKKEQQMRSLDPKKAEQVERLGKYIQRHRAATISLIFKQLCVDRPLRITSLLRTLKEHRFH